MLHSDPKKFWKTLCPKSANISPAILSDDGLILSSPEMAVQFNNFFSSVFTSEEPFSDLTHANGLLDAFMCGVTIDTYGVACAIDRLPTNSSPGPDGISTKLLKLTKSFSSIFLGRLFQQSIVTGTLPDDWKMAHVIPIFKSGDRASFTNYRPISLTCVSCKLIEHILSSNIMNYLVNNRLLYLNQHGFQKGRSCETQLFELVTDLHNNVHSSQYTDAIFIDLSKAFDRVPHKRLLHKLTKLNIDTPVITWIESFLSNRYQCVVINETVSPPQHVRSGVPQGSVLGPLLFLIYINDIHTNIKSNIRLFADDCVIYHPIRKESDSLELQNDLRKIYSWCENWQMKINIDKTKSVTFTTRSNLDTFIYKINETPIEKVSAFKYLGVHLSSNLTWNCHIEHITNKASKTLGFIKRHLALADQNTKLLAYTSLVRSQLEYASIIWNPHQTYLLNHLESVQNKAARFITRKYSRYDSVTTIKSSLELTTLEARRKNSRLSFFHTLYHGSSQFKEVNLKPAYRVSSRLDHPYKVQPIFARTNAYKNSPLPLAITDWNALPREIATLTDHTLFTNEINALY